jgi:hypothetical protein
VNAKEPPPKLVTPFFARPCHFDPFSTYRCTRTQSTLCNSSFRNSFRQRSNARLYSFSASFLTEPAVIDVAPQSPEPFNRIDAHRTSDDTSLISIYQTTSTQRDKVSIDLDPLLVTTSQSASPAAPLAFIPSLRSTVDSIFKPFTPILTNLHEAISLATTETSRFDHQRTQTAIPRLRLLQPLGSVPCQPTCQEVFDHRHHRRSTRLPAGC